MNSLDYLLTLINTHPVVIAMICVVITSVAVAILRSELVSRRINIAIANSGDFEGCVFMKLKGIQLFPENPAIDIQVIAYVNGMEFHYPSKDKEKWISMKQNMDDVTIELPNAELYHLHLAVHFRSGQTLEGGPSIVRRTLLQPQLSAKHTSLPVSAHHSRFAEDYKLYLLEDGLRDTSVKAIIPYEFYIQ